MKNHTGNIRLNFPYIFKHHSKYFNVEKSYSLLKEKNLFFSCGIMSIDMEVHHHLFNH